MFLLVHTSSTLLIRDERASYGPSPYVDNRGEQDIGLQRGRTLQLSAARYAQLRNMVLSASFDEQMLRGDAAQVIHSRNL